MELKENKPYLILFCLFALTVILVKTTGSVVLDERFPVTLSLPEKVGKWQGMTPLFCRNRDCSLSLSMKNIAGGAKFCPRCGGALDSISTAEKLFLPADTIILKKVYSNKEDHHCISVSVVIAGRSRSSIHRPEWCLPGQGQRVTGYASDVVNCGDGRIVPLAVLDVRSDAAPVINNSSLFVYWFVSPDGEVSGQCERLFRMAWDNIVCGVSRRWAYIVMMTDKSGDPEGVRDSERLKKFISDFYPSIRTVK